MHRRKVCIRKDEDAYSAQSTDAQRGFQTQLLDPLFRQAFEVTLHRWPSRKHRRKATKNSTAEMSVNGPTIFVSHPNTDAIPGFPSVEVIVPLENLWAAILLLNQVGITACSVLGTAAVNDASRAELR
jgi:hypothetical protein